MTLLLCRFQSGDCPTNCSATAGEAICCTGIHFAQKDEQTAAGELGQIRPPGGVPLSFGRPDRRFPWKPWKGRPERLEAVPPPNLEKWIDELERIIGRKLE